MKRSKTRAIWVGLILLMLYGVIHLSVSKYMMPLYDADTIDENHSMDVLVTEESIGPILSLDHTFLEVLLFIIAGATVFHLVRAKSDRERLKFIKKEVGDKNKEER
ncbi:hypothetical protein [Paenibacillus sp. 1001270B_150601_E10]|uniref:hypothetical protein n=1 Tax=Paenibacillus sp. 1001270B_150601_E10 TaxID=2787079 RepID=UPI00189FAAB7|nr:hypothetical protein [Paenibacillus sp. 1001270B_150601_E10]